MESEFDKNYKTSKSLSVNLMTRTEKEKLDFLPQKTDLYRNGEISRLEYLKRLGFRFRARTDV
jgi:hypothetical protein